jgi:hypothetical protein
VVLAGLGDEVDVGLFVLGHRGEQVEMVVALDFVRVLQGVVEIVPREYQGHAEGETQDETDGRDLSLLRPDGERRA